MFDPIQASNNIRDEFISYISTSFHLADHSYARQFTEALGKEGAISKGPYLDISDAFESGKSINTLIYENEMSPLFQELEPGVQDGDKEIKLVRGLYKHQEKAIRKINAGKNIVVTTGTGSGKTECFILPIINHLLREKEAGTLDDGVRAILIYPMNALANDQMKRLRLILKMYPDTSMDAILKQYDITADSTQSDSEILYNLCVSSTVYKILRECAIKPMTVHEIVSSMRKYMDLKDIDLVSFIHVASKAEKNKTALIKARYHMFVRALEGTYITLNSDKKLYLTRKNYAEIARESWKVFEAAVCDDCGRIGVAGKTINNHLESATNRYDETMEVYLLRLQGEELDVEEENDAEDENEIGKEDYLLCAKCGEIYHESQKLNFSCGHGEESLVRVKKAERKGTKNENKCPCCNLGHMKLGSLFTNLFKT